MPNKSVKQDFGSFPITDLGAEHFHLLEQPQCVNEQMAFAASHFFTPIIPTRIAAHGTAAGLIGCPEWLRLVPAPAQDRRAVLVARQH